MTFEAVDRTALILRGTRFDRPLRPNYVRLPDRRVGFHRSMRFDDLIEVKHAMDANVNSACGDVVEVSLQDFPGRSPASPLQAVRRTPFGM